MKNKTAELEYVGQVGVDSGQVMIVDPCYLGSFDNDTPPDGHNPCRDVETGSIYVLGADFQNYESKLSKYDGRTPNQLLETGCWEKVPRDWEKDKTHEFSYRGACRATTTKGGAGQLQYGFAGVIACQSGYGDGSYPVYIERNAEGRPMRLIVEFGESSEEETDDNS